MRDHLSDTTTYKSLTTSEIDRYSSDITKNILGWMKMHHKKLTKMERALLRKKLKSNQSPYARFYLTLKAHKLKPGQTVDDLKSRPIVSCPGSLLHGLGVWVDRKLQEVAQRIVSYFKNTLELKKELLILNLPRNARLFTADAVSMYTNIPPSTSPPPYATIYYGLHESNFLPKQRPQVILYKRFIDDVFGIWLPHPDPQKNERLWNEFTKTMNNYPGLTWEFNPPSDTVDFMDLTITLKNGKISTSLFEKPFNLHLYIPPTLPTPPGLLPGIVHSTLFRIFTLCSDPDDQLLRTKVFFKRLQARGYKSNQIKPLFLKAIARAKLYSGPNDTTNNDHTTVIFHLPYHPNDPPSHQIQQAWRQTVASPKYHMPLPDMRNPKSKEKCNIQRMIIAYRRPMNIGNLLSHRNLDTNSTAPPVSSYYPYD